MTKRKHKTAFPQVIIAGNSVDGFWLIGPFAKIKHAQTYVDTDPELSTAHTWIVPLYAPDPTPIE